VRGYLARLAPRVSGRGQRLAPGIYVLTVSAVNRHGATAPATVTLTVS